MSAMPQIILALLTPFLMTGGAPEALARQAASETIAGRTAPETLLAVAQSTAFALTAIDTLRLSLPPDLSLSMKLRLRGNANALNRSSQRSQPPAETTPVGDPVPAPAEDPTATIAALETAKTLVKQAKPGADAAWAEAMTDVAAEYQAALPSLSPADQQTHLARIGALSKIAATLSKGEAPSLKARLLGSTAIPIPPTIKTP
jgi:hypothetical protein